MTRIPDLDQLRIASPCSASWSEMEGDSRVRHCHDCNLNVYNFREMSRDEVADLIQRTEGRLCARMYKRRDGTLITRDCPRGKRAVVTKRATMAGFFLGAWAIAIGTMGRRPLDEREFDPFRPAPPTAEAMRDWPVAGWVVERLWPEPKVVMGVMPAPTLPGGP